MNKRIILLTIAALIGACTPASTTSPPETTTPGAPSVAAPTDTPEPEVQLPPVVGPDPSYRVGAFYYPWYANLETDNEWRHWEDGLGIRYQPPEDVSSDFYPVLGAYSDNDPYTVAQHMAWMREAGIGVAITSWWGQHDFTDEAVPLLLDMAAHYGIQVAFHVEIYTDRTAESLLDDVKYIYSNYGNHPGFYRTKETSHYSTDNREKGLFFIYASDYTDSTCEPISDCRIEENYWNDTIDAIHEMPEGGIVIGGVASLCNSSPGHFDGAYNFASLDLNAFGFGWARGLPEGAWFVPSVVPGFTARRTGDELTNIPRDGGATYRTQWEAALSEWVEPQMITISSFNEWHEGTQIEPAAANASNGSGFVYESYDPLPEDSYLTLTRELTDDFQQMDWSQDAAPQAHVQIRMTTTSDWTTLNLLEGGEWNCPQLIFASAEAPETGLGENQILLNQPLERAQAGESVEVVFEMYFTELDSEGTLIFGIERGGIGATTVDISKFVNDSPEVVATFVWDGNVPNQGNMEIFEMPTEKILDTLP